MAYRIGIDARKVADFGIGTYIRSLVHALAEVDQDNHYLLLVAPQGREALAGLPENFQLVQERSPVYSVRELFTLSWRLKRLELDLYHATHYTLPLMLPRRVVVTIHDIIHLLYPEFLPSRFAHLYAQGMIRRSLSKSDRVIAVSENTKADLMDYFRVGGEKIDVVYNGVDDLFRERLAEEDLARWLRQLGIDRPYLLFVGNPTKPHKNLDRVVQAYAKAVATAAFDAPLVCVGDRTAAQFKIRQRSEQLGVGDRVKLLGHVAQEALPALYQGAALFLYPTLYEGFGLPVVEAMASGTPVLTSSTSALKEVAGGHAHLVDPLDGDRMARAIARLMTDDEYRLSLGEKGRRRADDFRWRLAALRTLALYRETIEAPQAARRIRRRLRRVRRQTDGRDRPGGGRGAGKP